MDNTDKELCGLRIAVLIAPRDPPDVYVVWRDTWICAVQGPCLDHVSAMGINMNFKCIIYYISVFY